MKFIYIVVSDEEHCEALTEYFTNHVKYCYDDNDDDVCINFVFIKLCEEDE